MEKGVTPNCVLGTSLGEFTAAAVAGVIEVEDALECLVKYAELCETHCQKGGMLSIIHQPELYDETPLMYENSELVSFNFHSHFVVAGENDKLKIIGGFLKEKGISYQVLPVSYAFHSSLMDPISEIYKNHLKTKRYQTPQIPLVSGIHGDFITKIPADYFWNVTRKPIRFLKAMNKLESIGSHLYLDLGPAGTLSNFIKYILGEDRELESFSVMTPFIDDLKNFEQVTNWYRPGT